MLILKYSSASVTATTWFNANIKNSVLLNIFCQIFFEIQFEPMKNQWIYSEGTEIQIHGAIYWSFLLNLQACSFYSEAGCYKTTKSEKRPNLEISLETSMFKVFMT